MIVVDSSALVEALAGESPPDGLLAELANEALHVPHLLDYEFRSALRGLLLGRKISAARAQGARLVAEGLAMRRYPDTVTGPRAWDLRGSLGAYDATYVALAEILDCRLVTADGKIERATPVVRVTCY